MTESIVSLPELKNRRFVFRDRIMPETSWAT